MNILSGLLVFMFVTFAWLFFKLTNISDVVKYVAAIFNNTHVAPSMSSMAYVLMYSLPVIAYHLLYLSKNLMPDVLRWSNFEAYAHGLMLFMIVTNSGISGDFIYFQF